MYGKDKMPWLLVLLVVSNDGLRPGSIYMRYVS
jgi:hypothetical protein